MCWVYLKATDYINDGLPFAKSDAETCWGGYVQFSGDTNAAQKEAFTKGAATEPKQQQQQQHEAMLLRISTEIY